MGIIKTEDINDTSDTTNTIPTTITQDGTEDLEKILRKYSQSKDIIVGAKLDRDYRIYIELMEEKHKKKDLLIENTQQVVIIDSIDSAEHKKLQKVLLVLFHFLPLSLHHYGLIKTES